jgi:hypothetical protein
MGKAANIKRAKMLKEAKRKREQEALLAASLGPGSIAIQKRTEASGMKLIPNESGIKYSELLKEFMEPYMDADDPIDVIRSKYGFGILAWNVALKKEAGEEEYLRFKNEITAGLPAYAFFKDLFEELVARKLEKFGHFNKTIADYEIKKIRGQDYHLTVATFIDENITL